MDELRVSLAAYRAQLAQIETAIVGGQNDGELLSLQQEMKELISLTEESLLAYEKSSMLSSLDENAGSDRNPPSPHATDAARMDEIMTSFYADLDTDSTEAKSSQPNEQSTISPQEPRSDPDVASDNEEGAFHNDEFLRTIEYSEDITGVKCQAPHETEWAGKQFHNAMIMSVEDGPTNDAESIFVKVLYLNPTLEGMKPCPYYLDGNCRFTEGACKFSHGERLSLFELRKFKEPDFSNFCVGSLCLAKLPSGVWHPATLVKTHENFQYDVKFSLQNTVSKLGVDDVFPLPHEADEQQSPTSDDDDPIIPGWHKNEPDDFKELTPNNFGEWERFTNGFGSKMLLKFGYKMGDGLGSDKKGRVEPVPVVVLPPGKSLDYCMKMKEKQSGIEPGSSNPPRKKRRRTVFHFLNRTLGDTQTTTDYLRKLLPKDSFGIKKTKPKSGQCKISVEMVKNESKIKQLKDKARRYEESIARNRLKDPKVAKKQQLKLNETIAELERIQSDNKVIELHQNRADTHRKMTRF